MDFIPVVGSVIFIVFIYFCVITYRKKKKSEEFKKPLLISIALFALSGILVALYSTESVKSISITDVQVFKDSSSDFTISTEPEKANNVDQIKCETKDKNIAMIDKETIKGIEDGKTTYTCKIGDVVSNEGTIEVSLTDEQKAVIEEAKKQEEEEKAKRKQEEREQAAKDAEAKRNTISDSEKVRLKSYAEELIDSVLKSPSTSEYPGSFLSPYTDWSFYKKNNLVTIKSYVDAQNSFGAQLRSVFIIQVQLADGGSGEATYVELDGQIYKGSFQQ